MQQSIELFLEQYYLHIFAGLFGIFLLVQAFKFGFKSGYDEGMFKSISASMLFNLQTHLGTTRID